MTNLRKAILIIILTLTFVFNIEKIDVAGQNLINIQSFLYVLIFVAVVSTLLNQNIQRLSVLFSVVFWNIIYIALKLFVFNSRPLVGSIYTYLTITELTLLTAAVLLTDHLAKTLLDYESVVEKITLHHDGQQRVTGMSEAQEIIKTEFIRSRRHQRPLSVIVIEMDPHTNQLILEQTVKNIQQRMLNRFLFVGIAKILSDIARRTDVIIEQSEKNRFVLLCPETNGPGSITLVQRFQDLAIQKLGVIVKCGVASFPDEALTFEDLEQKAQLNLLSSEELKEKLQTGELQDNQTEMFTDFRVIEND